MTTEDQAIAQLHELKGQVQIAAIALRNAHILMAKMDLVESASRMSDVATDIEISVVQIESQIKELTEPTPTTA